MGCSYTPTYYSSLHDTITSICKSILPFSFKRRLPAHRQADNLKWQQESFHRILQLIGLHREGILPESEVIAYRTQLLESIVASPAEPDSPAVIRDKLLFLQELLYAKCISTKEYHRSKRPLLQRLAAQGVEIDARDVVVGEDAAAIGNTKPEDEEEEEQWSVIDLKDKDVASTEKAKKHKLKGAMSLFGRGKAKKDPLSPVDLNQFNSKPPPPPSILMAASSPGDQKSSAKSAAGGASKRKKAFRGLFQKENAVAGDSGGKRGTAAASSIEKNSARPSCSGGVKKPWGLDGLKRWKRGGCEDVSAEPYLPAAWRGDTTDGGGGGGEGGGNECALVASPVGEGPDTKRIKKKLHSDGSPSDFFIDKVLGENIKKELLRIQIEMNASNTNLTFSNDQIEAISTSLPLDKADLSKFFPKPWCDKYGDVVLEVVRKEFKDHVGEMEIQRNAVREKRAAGTATVDADGSAGSAIEWVKFDDDDDKEKTLLVNHRTDDSKNPFCHRKSTNPFLEEDDEDNQQIEEALGHGATSTTKRQNYNNNPFAGHSGNPFHDEFCNPFCGPNAC